MADIEFVSPKGIYSDRENGQEPVTPAGIIQEQATPVGGAVPPTNPLMGPFGWPLEGPL